MRIVRHDMTVPFDVATSLTVGTFDGVHCGHRSIIENMQSVAAKHNERTVVVTFDPHPQIVLAKPDRDPLLLLTTIDERLEYLQHAGVDVTVVIDFTKEFAATPAETFVREQLVARIGVQHFFIGHDHMFGQGRVGNEELLQHLGAELGFAVEPVSAYVLGDNVVSSTKVRNALRDGNIAMATEMLGRPYALRGTVVRGDQRGRKLGIPTANIVPNDARKVVPGKGVYVVSAAINDTTVFGMANIGRRPTFTDDTHTTLEVHFLEFDAMLYDAQLTLHFHSYVRPEMKFESVDMFISQVRDDRATAMEFAEAWRDGRAGNS